LPKNNIFLIKDEYYPGASREIPGEHRVKMLRSLQLRDLEDLADYYLHVNPKFLSLQQTLPIPWQKTYSIESSVFITKALEA